MACSGLRIGLPLYLAVPPPKTQFQPLPRVTAWWAAQRSAHRLPIEVMFQTCDASYAVHAGSRVVSPVVRPLIGYGRRARFGVAEQVRAEEAVRAVAGDRQDLGCGLHESGREQRDELLVGPDRIHDLVRGHARRRRVQGGFEHLDAARQHELAAGGEGRRGRPTGIVPLRFVRPVTTASGNSRAAAAVGLGMAVAVGSAGVSPGVGVVAAGRASGWRRDGAGVGPDSHPASSARTTTRVPIRVVLEVLTPAQRGSRSGPCFGW